MSTMQALTGRFSQLFNKKKVPHYKLTSDLTTASSTGNDKATDVSRAQFRDFLCRAKEANIRVEIDDGWEVVDKEDVEQGIRKDQEDQDALEWDLMEDEMSEIRSGISNA